ncbi:MAG: SsrA-binding protein SmpB [Clostridia bacterium]|nr:SsrA-binding protein SmpB [Clostridia bacterium]
MSIKVISTNKKANFNYFIENKLEAGISLLGPEVKSLRAGSCSMEESFIYITSDKEIFVKNMFIKNFAFSTNITIDEKRDRKLLLNKNEIEKLLSKVREKGYTLVPLKVYFSGKFIKMEIGVCKGKHTYDKKDTLKEKDLKRETDRMIKNYN